MLAISTALLKSEEQLMKHCDKKLKKTMKMLILIKITYELRLELLNDIFPRRKVILCHDFTPLGSWNVTCKISFSTQALIFNDTFQL